MSDATASPNLRETAVSTFKRRQLLAMGLPALILAYFVYIFFAFDIPGLAERADWEDGQHLIADSYSYKVHVSRQARTGIVAQIEGNRRFTFDDATMPDWVEIADETAVIDLGDGHLVTYFDGNGASYDIPEFGLITMIQTDDGVGVTWPEGVDPDALPEWISVSDNRVGITTDAGRFSITRNRTETFNYQPGWELFWFTLDSPYYGQSFGQVMGAMFSGEFGAVMSDFWNNDAWRHADVAWAIFETILMAFLGTFGAAIVALPIAFMAAQNFTPYAALRFGIRRFFDFLRGVDALIWTIILSRAFGLGPLTGGLAILITDTGSFGKLFSEALENVDEKQIEGVQSTGAKPVQRYRFGVIPQVMPVLLSQVLYFFESNTRSATIVGAITGGGIGLFVTNAINTGSAWEKVTYYIILILLMVILMDWVSGILRRRLIQGDESGR